MGRTWWHDWTKIGLLLGLTLGGCGSPGRFLSSGVEGSGLSLNSPYNETDAQVVGRYVVFSSDRSGSQDIYLWDILDRRLVPLPNLNRLDTLAKEPSISEDGRYIAFWADRPDRQGVYVYDRNSQQQRLITGNIRNQIRHPRLSADGRYVTFEVNSRGQWDVAVYTREGQPLPLATNPQ